MNPSRQRKASYQPAPVTLAVLTHLPHEAGYFEHRFAVTRACLESLITNTPEPFDLLVFDNGSCPQLVAYLVKLRDEGKIDFLLLSGQNIGKIAALQIIFQAAPGEIVAYTDDDVYFLPGWLEAHLKILNTYPNTGLVTGFYIRSHLVYGIESTMKFAEQLGVNVQRGLLIPEEDERHYYENMGRTLQDYQQETSGLEDIQLTYQGVDALVSAGHHQFVAPKAIIRQALPAELGSELMGRMVELETTIDRLGYLRLSTLRPVTRLLGNVISEAMAQEARLHGLNVTAGVSLSQASSGLKQFYRHPWVRRLAQALYNRMYKILNA
jgi:glycosyltransferase involved in cell wall biosynthesis